MCRAAIIRLKLYLSITHADSIIQNSADNLCKFEDSVGDWHLKTRFIPSASLESLVVVRQSGQHQSGDEHLLLPQMTLAAILERLSSNVTDPAARHQSSGIAGSEAPTWPPSKMPGSAQRVLAAENTLREFERAATAGAAPQQQQQQGALVGGANAAFAFSPNQNPNPNVNQNAVKNAFDSVVSDVQTAMRQPAVAEKFEQVASLGNSLKEKLKTHATRAVNAMLQSPQSNRGASSSPSRTSLEPPANRRSMIESFSSDSNAALSSAANRSHPASASTTPTHVLLARGTSPPQPVAPLAAAAPEPNTPTPATVSASGEGPVDSSKSPTPRPSSSSAVFTMFPLPSPPATASTRSDSEPASSTAQTPVATSASGAGGASGSSGTGALRSNQVDTKSCVQFLLDLFQQWFSVFTPSTAEKLPISLASETITSVC